MYFDVPRPRPGYPGGGGDFGPFPLSRNIEFRFCLNNLFYLKYFLKMSGTSVDEILTKNYVPIEEKIQKNDF